MDQCYCREQDVSMDHKNAMFIECFMGYDSVVLKLIIG